ncbi:MAG TPA: RluA family pseudouridine synthase [Chloroflexi bacterium]|nr:RluA family pseudouridine synthase [Chloroflexota bacterium]HBY08704.1 RluA family pseudouridine synthase [Chloroflexota bacterium]
MPDPIPTILHSDSNLLVIDKPAGVLSIPDGYDHTVPYLGRLLEPAYGRLWVVHRLDKETSGVMVFARTPEAHKALSTQFSTHQVSKIYHAIIEGQPEWDDTLLDLPLRANVGRRNRTTVDIGEGKQARTLFRVLERYTGFALLEASPYTGRTHQIRAHLFDLGFSILSDPLYGAGLISPFIGRLALHARTLSFWHPFSGEMLTFEAPYPDDFNLGVSQLRFIASTT